MKSKQILVLWLKKNKTTANSIVHMHYFVQCFQHVINSDYSKFKTQQAQSTKAIYSRNSVEVGFHELTLILIFQQKQLSLMNSLQKKIRRYHAKTQSIVDAVCIIFSFWLLYFQRNRNLFLILSPFQNTIREFKDCSGKWVFGGEGGRDILHALRT